MLKRLVLLSLTVILSWNSFSQTVTENRDTTGIVLSTNIARRVAVDLLEGDRAKEEVQLLNQEVDTLKQIVALQDSLGILKDNKIAALNKVLELQSVEDKENLRKLESLNKELRKQTALKTVFEVTTGISVIALIVSLIFGGK